MDLILKSGAIIFSVLLVGDLFARKNRSSGHVLIVGAITGIVAGCCMFI